MLDTAIALTLVGLWALGAYSIPKCLSCISGPRNDPDEGQQTEPEETTALYSKVYPMAEQVRRIDSDKDFLRNYETFDDEELLVEAEMIESSAKVYTFRTNH